MNEHCNALPYGYTKSALRASLESVVAMSMQVGHPRCISCNWRESLTSAQMIHAGLTPWCHSGTG
jgi:hypothetical protein